MVKVVNIFKAAGVWVGAIFLLYGNREVSSTVARAYYSGGGTALAPSRSAEQGSVQYGGTEFEKSQSFGHDFMSPLEIKIGGQTGRKTGRLKTPVTERGGGYG